MIHPFEKSGLGSGPYRYTGCESRDKDVKRSDGTVIINGGGTTCDHCGTYIFNVMHFENGEGSKFKTGVDCALKAWRQYDADTGNGRSRGTAKVEAVKRSLAKKARKAREARKLEELKILLVERADHLAAIPHPKAWGAAQGLTWNHYAEWMIKNSGAAGKGRLLNELKAL